jgi:phosphoribosylformylglycinamidine synthase
MNPRYGDYDTYHMAASAIDEAVRNCVAVGADPRRIAILDNFCWGDCEKPETLGSLVRAATACYDVATVLGTPFISGKDSLNNEFTYTDESGRRRTIAIPPSLLISAIGQVEDVSKCVTMDLKEHGNLLYIVGETRAELGGSHFALVNNLDGGQVPIVDPAKAKEIFEGLHRAVKSGTIKACHDLSEGGLAAAIAEMAFAGGFGARIEADLMPSNRSLEPATRLFSESNSRFLCEVAPQSSADFERTLGDMPHARVGEVTHSEQLIISVEGKEVINSGIRNLKEAWQALLN